MKIKHNNTIEGNIYLDMILFSFQFSLEFNRVSFLPPEGFQQITAIIALKAMIIVVCWDNGALVANHHVKALYGIFYFNVIKKIINLPKLAVSKFSVPLEG